jgi:hypothetical protein
MVVMVAVGSWSLGHVSTVGIVYVFYGINLFFVSIAVAVAVAVRVAIVTISFAAMFS